MRPTWKKTLILLLFTGSSSVAAFAGIVKGIVTDRQTREPLIGATIQIANTSVGTITDMDGKYSVEIRNGSYTLVVRYVGYKDAVRKDISVGDEPVTINFELETDAQSLNEVSVTATAKKNNENILIQEQKRSLVVQTGISAGQIAKTQDRDASEVIKRVPGVSIIDDKFVMVRGLSQRYNNVWLNGSAVPSSEADSRAFSFDLIPSSQLDNMIIVKSPAPEYPSDFSGGFILVNTKDIPGDSGLNIAVEAGINDQTHFRNYLKAAGSGMDWLGFGTGYRSLDAGMTGKLLTYPGYENGNTARIDVLGNGFHNDWTLHRKNPLGDLKLSASYNRKWETESGRMYGLLAAINYGNSYKTYRNMENSLYGPYDTAKDEYVYFRKATDNQYNNDIRLGAMLNLSLRPVNQNHHFEWKNIFNRLAKDRYSERNGFNAQPDNINNMEYYYSSRTTYNTQFTGKHTLGTDHHMDWSIGYAYADKSLPDRRLIERTDRTNNTMGIYRISREFTGWASTSPPGT